MLRVYRAACYPSFSNPKVTTSQQPSKLKMVIYQNKPLKRNAISLEVFDSDTFS